MKYEFVAVDFDGTLCKDAFPDIGEPNRLCIAYVKRLAAEGSKIILHTCRENGTRKLLDEAVGFCNAQGIPLFAVNENPGNTYPARFGLSPEDGRKVYADLYIDDKAMNPATIRHGDAFGWAARKHGRAILKYAILTACGIALYCIASAFAFAERGYRAVGGEIFLLFLPLWYWLISQTVGDFFNIFTDSGLKLKNIIFRR